MSGYHGNNNGTYEDSAAKSLHLRQQANKPRLKYNANISSGSSTKLTPAATATTAANGVRAPAVPLLEPAELQYLQQQASSYSAVSSGSLVASALGYKPQLLSAYTFLTSNTNTAGMISNTVAPPSNKVTRNPYKHPLSAKDLQPQDQMYISPTALLGSTSALLRSSSTSSIVSTGSNYNLGARAITPSPPVTSPSPVVQTNSFMRPQSAFRTESRNAKVGQSRASVVPAGSHPGIAVESKSFSVVNRYDTADTKPPAFVPKARTSPTGAVSAVPRPPSASRPSFVRTNSAGSLIQNSTETTNIWPAPIPKDAFIHPTTVSVVAGTSSVSDANNNSQKAKVKPEGTISKSSIPMPGSAVRMQHLTPGVSVTGSRPQSVSSAGSSTRTPPGGSPQKHSVTSGGYSTKPPLKKPAAANLKRSNTIIGGPLSNVKVRNPSYTPTKPYSEVCSPQPSLDRSQSQEPEEEHSGSSAGSRIDSADTSGRQTPTLFYRKASKTEEVLHDMGSRAKADGAPSTGKTKELRGAGGLDDGEEWEDVDEDEDNFDATRSERLPGDGEDDDDDDDDDEDDVDDEDDMIDTLDDDVDEGSDDESDGYSMGSSAHRGRTPVRIRSATKRLLGLSISKTSPTHQRPTPPSKSRPTTAKARPMSAVSTISSDSDIQPALQPSLFANVPPTINFAREGERVEQLPWEIRKFLKWRMSPVTPNVVKNCIFRSGFRPSKKNHDWLGYWGKHMKAQGFKSIREYQKINHFPGSFQIGRKDRLWRNLSRLQVHFGKKEFGFFPQTYVLPFDLKQLKRAWEDGGNKQKWIIKPPASARGIGIKVIHKWNQIPRRRPVIVQKYLSRPYLINDSKFDLRIYVYVTSYDPLRLYVYDDGLVRFASAKYSHSMKNLNNKYMHLTNYSINKKNNEYQSNTDENVCQGHKWSLHALWGYLRKRGVDTSKVWDNMVDLIIKTIISSESCVNSLVKCNVRRRTVCHELFGFDIMLDDCLKPWIIEVNISPSLHSNSQLDINIKGGMIKDLLNLAGFMIPPRNEVVPHAGAPPEPSRYVVPQEICIDARMYPAQMSPDERSKHAYYCQRHTDQYAQSTILDILTPSDLRILVETLDEDSRRGNFQRVFPNVSSHKYLRYFDQPRYCNLLMDMWVQKYHRTETRGVALVDSHCQQGLHLEQYTENPKHQWAPPTAGARAISAPGGQVKIGPGGSLPTLRKKTKGQGSTLSSMSSLSASTGTISRPSTHRSTASNNTR